MPKYLNEKLQELLLFILSETGRGFGGVELAKVVYLIDMEHLKIAGKTYTGENYNRAPKGPLPENWSYTIEAMDGHELNVKIGASRGNSEHKKHNHVLGDDPRLAPKLEGISYRIAVSVLERIAGLEPKEIEALAYNTEPMLAIQAKENKLHILCLGESLDLNLIQRDRTIQMWEANKRKARRTDHEYQAFLKKESKEIDELLEAISAE